VYQFILAIYLIEYTDVITLYPLNWKKRICFEIAIFLMRTLDSDCNFPYPYKELLYSGFIFAKVDKFLNVAEQQAQEMKELSLDSANITDYAGIIIMKY
jgi:hypothetical protein